MATSHLTYEPFYDIDTFLSADDPTRHPDHGAGHGHQPVKKGIARPLRPKMDLHENHQTNTVTATFELPGMKKKDIHISLRDGRLIVSGESRLSTEHEQDGYTLRERQFGKFVRTLHVPKDAKEENVTASMEDGVLTVTFPKSTPEGVRNIQIA